MYTYLLDLFLRHSEIATDWIIALSCLGFSISATIIGARALKYVRILNKTQVHHSEWKAPKIFPGKETQKYPWHQERTQ